jgi:nucleotide-binding universal stress UspA family protein
VRRRDARLARMLIIRCGWETRRGGVCRVPAGHRTRHPGYGPCRTHGSARAHRAWEWAMEVARELNVTPWEALLKSVRLAAGRSAWVDAQLQRAVEDATTGENDGGTADSPQVMRWLTESRKERTLLARFAKAAIDAGVAERLVRNVELEGQVIAEVIGKVIDQLGLPSEQRIAAFNAAHVHLAALESPDGQPVTLEGTWNPLDGGNAGGPEPGDEGEAEQR